MLDLQLPSAKLVPVILSSYMELTPLKKEAAEYNVKVIDSSNAERMVMFLRGFFLWRTVWVTLKLACESFSSDDSGMDYGL